jgi:hypothetical protein
MPVQAAASCGLQVLEIPASSQAALHHPDVPASYKDLLRTGTKFMRQAALHRDQPSLYTEKLLVTGVTAWSTEKQLQKIEAGAGNWRRSLKGIRQHQEREQQAPVLNQLQQKQVLAAGCGKEQQLLRRLQHAWKPGSEQPRVLRQELPKVALLLDEGRFKYLLLPNYEGFQRRAMLQEVSRPRVHTTAAVTCGQSRCCLADSTTRNQNVGASSMSLVAKILLTT